MPKILANSLRSKDEQGVWTDIPVVIKDDAKPSEEQIHREFETYMAEGGEQHLDNDVDQWMDTNVPQITADAVTDWLDDNVDPVGSAVVVDSSLLIEGAAADSKVTGDEINAIRNEISDEGTVVTDGSTLLSDVLTDTSGTVANVTYTLEGNQLSYSGTSSGNNVISILPYTDKLPTGIEPGKLYVISLTITGTDGLISFAAKTTSNTTSHTVKSYKKSGLFYWKAPDDLLQLRVAAHLHKNVQYDNIVTIEFSAAENLHNTRIGLDTIANQPHLEWNLGTYINSTTGETGTNGCTATTSPIPVSEGDVVYRYVPTYDSDGVNLSVFYIAQYKENGFYNRSGNLKYGESFVIDPDVTHIKIGFGRATSTSVVITQTDIDQYYKTIIYRKSVIEADPLCYWRHEINTSAESINDNIFNASLDSTTLLIVTDCHWYTNAKNSPAISKEIMKLCGVNYFMNLGDYLYGINRPKQESVDEIRDCIAQFRGGRLPMITLFGNHEIVGTANHPELKLNFTEISNLIYKEWAVDPKYTVYSGTYQEVERPYEAIVWDDKYYRYVCIQYLISNDFSPEWISEICNTSKPIVVLTHGIYASMNENEKECEWILNAFEPYKEQIKCFIQGHSHIDGLRRAYSNRVPIIVLDQDTMQSDSTKWTITEQSLSAITIEHEKISVVKIGRGTDFVVDADTPDFGGNPV